MPIAPQGFPVMPTFDLDAKTRWTARCDHVAESALPGLKAAIPVTP